MTPYGKQAEILAVSKFKNYELELLNGFLSVPYEYENTFAGSIIPSDNKDNVSPDLKLVVSGVSTSILLRNSLQEKFE